MVGKKLSKSGKPQQLKVTLSCFQVGMTEAVADLEKTHPGIRCPLADILRKFGFAWNLMGMDGILRDYVGCRKFFRLGFILSKLAEISRFGSIFCR